MTDEYQNCKHLLKADDAYQPSSFTLQNSLLLSSFVGVSRTMVSSFHISRSYLFENASQKMNSTCPAFDLIFRDQFLFSLFSLSKICVVANIYPFISIQIRRKFSAVILDESSITRDMIIFLVQNRNSRLEVANNNNGSGQCHKLTVYNRSPPNQVCENRCSHK